MRPGEESVRAETGKQTVWPVAVGDGLQDMCAYHKSVHESSAELANQIAAQTGLAQEEHEELTPHTGTCVECKRRARHGEVARSLETLMPPGHMRERNERDPGYQTPRMGPRGPQPRPRKPFDPSAPRRPFAPLRQSENAAQASRDELKPLPEKLYHVTTARDAVLEHGLKTRSELGQQYGHGLGGGEDDTISLTTHRPTAEHLLHSLHEYHNVLNGKIKLADLKDKAARGVSAQKPYDYMLKDHPDEELEAADRGRAIEHRMHDRSEVGADWHPLDEGMHGTGPHGEYHLHMAWDRPLGHNELISKRSDIYKKFAWGRQAEGGHLDPLFIANDPINFASKDPSQFALMHVRSRPGAHGIQMNDRTEGTDAGEWRAKSGKDLDVVYHEGVEDIPHRIAVTAELGDATDWDAHELPDTVHRGYALQPPGRLIDLVGDPDADPGHVAKEIINRTSRRAAGQHWSTRPETARDFAASSVRTGSSDLPVVLHARTPSREDIETRPAMLKRMQIFDYGGGAHDEREVPVRKGRTMMVSGVSWRPYNGHPAADESGWVHHDFSEPMLHRAAKYPIKYTRMTQNGYEDVEDEIEGPLYHGSRSKRLQPGDEIKPGRKTNPWGDEGTKSQHVFFTQHHDTARDYADQAGGHVYEVEPTGEFKHDYSSGDYKTKSPLRVVRMVPRSEWEQGKTAATLADDHPDKVYLRFGHWPKDERSQNNVMGWKEDGVSVYDLDHHGEPVDPDAGLNRWHEHDENCEGDCDLDQWNDDYSNNTGEEMQGRVQRAELNRRKGRDFASDTGHLVKGKMVGVGHDGEPLLHNVKRVGDWIDHRHHFIPTAEPHRLARGPYDEGYEPPKLGKTTRTAAMHNPNAKKGQAEDEWYHGSPHDFDTFYDTGSSNDDEDRVNHWNVLLGNHFTATHNVAHDFSMGLHHATDENGYEGEEPLGHVIHAKLHIKRPKVYKSEHDMDQEVHEHEVKRGNLLDHHLPDRPGEDADEDEWDDYYDQAGNARVYRGDSNGPFHKDEPDPNVAYGFHPKATGWLNHHPDKEGIARRFKDRLIKQGYDGIVYGNEFERADAGGKETSAIAFHPHQIEITQHHYGRSGKCLNPEECARQRREEHHPGQQELPLHTSALTAGSCSRLAMPLPQEAWDRYHGGRPATDWPTAKDIEREAAMGKYPWPHVEGPNGEPDEFPGTGIKQVRHSADMPVPLYHGTSAKFEPGDLISPGHPGNFVRRMKHVYMVEDPEHAQRYGWHGLGPDWDKTKGNEQERHPRVYEVRPTGPYGHRSDAKGMNWASEEPLEVVREVWHHEPKEHTAMRREAHDSGDGQRIFHCPFCGAGQVIARSDGTVECEFCHTAFTVQVQPQFNSFPQTDPTTGLPIMIPGMPGQIDAPGTPGAPGGALPPGADDGSDNPFEDGSGDDSDAQGPPGADDDSANGGDDDKPDFLKGSSYRTAAGDRLTEDQYVRHLALRFAPDPEKMIASLRGRR